MRIDDAEIVQLMKQSKIQFKHQSVLSGQNLVQSKITSYFGYLVLVSFTYNFLEFFWAFLELTATSQ